MMAFLLNVFLDAPLPPTRRDGRRMCERAFKEVLTARYRAMGSRLSQEQEVNLESGGCGWFRLCPDEPVLTFLNTVTMVVTRLPRISNTANTKWDLRLNLDFHDATLCSDYPVFRRIRLGKEYIKEHGEHGIPHHAPWGPALFNDSERSWLRSLVWRL